MTNRSGSWVKTTLDANSTGNWGVNYINIMLDEGDDPHVVYSDMVDYDIFYMSNTWNMGTHPRRWRFHQQEFGGGDG